MEKLEGRGGGGGGAAMQESSPALAAAELLERQHGGSAAFVLKLEREVEKEIPATSVQSVVRSVMGNLIVFTDLNLYESFAK